MISCTASVIVVYTLQLQHNSILYYYSVAEMHVFLSEVDLSRLASGSRVFKSIDNDLVDRLIGVVD